MRIAIAADHAGYDYKVLLVEKLKQDGYAVVDLGTDGTVPTDDYPDHAEDVANSILNEETDRGILICGSGVGVSVAANKFKGIRAGVCHDTYSAHQCVEHDDANVLCIGERIVGIALMFEIVDAFITAEFSGEPRHVRRVSKIAAIEEKNMKDERGKIKATE
jgi:ribose 5-phosphate isomerase B